MVEWIPGRIVSESVDPFHMTSIDYFEKWGREPVERILAAFDGGVLHIHGNGRHLLEAVSTLRGLKAVFLADDLHFPPAFSVLGKLRRRLGRPARGGQGGVSGIYARRSNRTGWKAASFIRSRMCRTWKRPTARWTRCASTGCEWLFARRGIDRCDQDPSPGGAWPPPSPLGEGCKPSGARPRALISSLSRGERVADGGGRVRGFFRGLSTAADDGGQAPLRGPAVVKPPALPGDICLPPAFRAFLQDQVRV